MKKRLRKFLLWAPLAKVAKHMGLDIHGWKCFSWVMAEFMPATGSGGAHNVRDVNWEKVNYIKEYGCHQYADEKLALYKAKVQQEIIDLRASGVTLNEDDRQEVVREAQRNWNTV